MTNFEQLPHEQKIERIYGYALMHCQSFIGGHDDLPELKNYVEELKAIIDFIQKSYPDAYEGMRLY